MLSTSTALLLSIITVVSAEYGPRGRYRGGPGDYYGGDWDNDGNYGPYGGYGAVSESFITSRQKILVAHGVLAALAFVLFFPVGAILIRVGSFRGVWLVHGIFQLFAYIVYIAAFGIGVWMVNNLPVNLLDSYHPIIGIIVFVLLFFQPILGFLHHVQYKKYNRRTIWSHGHLWLGRIVITLGMINGGLGLLLASDAPVFTGFAPSQGEIIAYSVIAAIMWLLWVASAIFGERKRTRAQMEANASPPPYNKEQYAHRASDESWT